MPYKAIKNTFNSGELSEQISGRTDLAKYYNGCSQMVNATVLPYGGAVKRSGTVYIAKAKGACKLFPFEFSVDDSLIIEAGNLYMRFYKNGARVLETVKTITGATQTNPVVITLAAHGYENGDWVKISDVSGMDELNGKEYIVANKSAGDFEITDTDGNDVDGTGFGAYAFGGDSEKVYEVVTPYSATEVFEMHVSQSGDVMYIAHEDYYPRKLSRVADTNWTLAAMGFDGGPFLTENTTAESLMQFTRTGGTAASGYYFPVGATGTLTASGTGNAPFLSSHVGSYWKLEDTRLDNETSSVDTAIKIKGDFTFDAKDLSVLWRKQGNGEWQKVRTFSGNAIYTGTEEEDDVEYKFSVAGENLTAKNQTNIGIVKVTALTSATVVTVEVVQDVYRDGGAGASSPTTAMWSEGAWSEYRGYPRTVSFHEDRLWWASSANNPQTLWGSVSSDYENHESGTDDDDAVIFAINDNDVSQIQWIMNKGVFAIGTANKEYSMTASNPDDPIAPSDVKVQPQSSHGSDTLQPKSLNNALFFIQKQGNKLRGMSAENSISMLKSLDMTMLANHMFESRPIDMASQRTPDSLLWVVRTDGTLLSFSYEPEEDVTSGWSRHVTGSSLLTPIDTFESVAVINGSVEDELWVVVNRTGGRYIERFSTRFFDQLDEAVMVDSAITIESLFNSKTITLASDTVRCGSGNYGSSYYGGTYSG